MIELTTGQIIAGLGVLVSFIGVLLKTIHSHLSKSEERAVKLEERQSEQNERVLALTSKVGRLEGEREGFMLGVEKISSEVLNELRDLKND